MSVFKVFLDKADDIFFPEGKTQGYGGYRILMKFVEAFVERFEKPSKRIMILLITRMKRSISSTSSSYTDCAELEFSLEVRRVLACVSPWV